MVCALTFAHQERLWWLLLLPVLFWLAMPPRPRRVLWTPHLAQWTLAHRALRRRPPRLRGLRFLLLAVACTAMVCAHAGLVVPGQPGPNRLVVLLDASASMAARSGADRTAFDVAAATLREAFARLPARVEVTLLRCGGAALRRHGPSARALHDLGEPGGALGVDLADLAERAAAPDTQVWTLTDGQGGGRLPAAGALTLVGGPVPNGAVLAVRTVDRWPLPRFDIEVDLAAWTSAPVDAVLRVQGAVAAEPPRTLQLAPGAVATAVFELTRTAGGGGLELVLEVPGDALPGDDRWRVELPPLPAPRIAVLADAEAGPYVAVAARALADEVGGSVVPAAAGGEVGLLLVDGGAVALVPGQARAVCFGSRFEGGAEPQPWLAPVVADWDRSDALTAGLDLSELRVASASRETLPPGQPFLWAAEAAGRTPLAVVVGDDRRASVHFGFRLQDSNLPLLPAFPQLLRRAFVRAYGAGAQLRGVTPPPPAGEQDLLPRAGGVERPLAAFGTEDLALAPHLLLAALAALALRAFVR